jgi:hypothetical protein
MKTLNARTCLRVAVLLAAASCCVLTQAQTLTTLHNFTGANGDGEVPYAQNLPIDANGAIYGTTAGGGNTQWGTVFQLVPPTKQGGAWAENVIYTFQGNADGAQPQSGLVFDQIGNLYGATMFGGNPSACGGGCGTIYELSPPAQPGGTWTHTVLYTFGGGFDGFRPGAVVFGPNGSLFGTTQQGGAQTIHCVTQYPRVMYGCGTVYELAPPAKRGGSWTKTILHTFPGETNDGQNPGGSELVFDSQGNLYGIAGNGIFAASRYGIVFQLTPHSGGSRAWTENILHFFSGGSDGGYPGGGLTLGPNGTIYGVASTTDASNSLSLSGAVYELTESGGVWTETVLHTFPAFAGDGTQPGSTLALDSSGNLYGTTDFGGTTNCTTPLQGDEGCGTVFKLAPPSGGGGWTETVLQNWPNNGQFPYETRVVLHNGLLYGTADMLGTEALGLAFSLTP